MSVELLNNPLTQLFGTSSAANATAAEPKAAGLLPVESSFSQELDDAARKQQRAREAADQLVASAFVLPVLQEVRNSPFKTELFSGGRGEEVFGQQLDVILAERITQSANFGLSEALTRQFGQADPEAPETKVDLRG